MLKRKSFPAELEIHKFNPNPGGRAGNKLPNLKYSQINNLNMTKILNPSLSSIDHFVLRIYLPKITS
jgi:hypothetical protein